MPYTNNRPPKFPLSEEVAETIAHEIASPTIRSMVGLANEIEHQAKCLGRMISQRQANEASVSLQMLCSDIGRLKVAFKQSICLAFRDEIQD